MRDKQLSHLVKSPQRHQSDRGDSIVSRVGPTLLVKCKGEIFYEAGCQWEQNLHDYMRRLIISKVLRDKKWSCSHRTSETISIAKIQIRVENPALATFPKLFGAVKSWRGALGNFNVLYCHSILHETHSVQRHSNRSSQS